MEIKALDDRPEISDEVDYLLNINANLNLFSENLNQYCMYHNITSDDEREYLMEMILFIRSN